MKIMRMLCVTCVTASVLIASVTVLAHTATVSPENLFRTTYRAAGVSLPNEIGHGLASGSDVAPAVTIVASETNTTTTYLPLVFRRGPELHGWVTLNGEAASGIPISLYWCCVPFDPWSVYRFVMSTTTNADGGYNFVDVPTLATGEWYFVQYEDYSGDPARLSEWTTARLTSYETGSPVSMGTFDLSNVVLVEPALWWAGSPPITFRWIPRASVLSDTYGIVLVYAPTECFVNHLGYVDSYTLEPGTPPNRCYPWPGYQYTWTVRVYSPDGGYGNANDWRTIYIDFSD